MTTTTQQIPSNPALDFANAILEDTNNGLELIEILHDIAQGKDETATPNDRITAANTLADRGLGKCPRQSPVTDPNPAPKTNDDDTRANHEPPANPRPVTQIKDALNDTLGPPPKADTPPTHSALSTTHSPLSPIQTIIQQHVLEITNNGQTIRDTLEEIARATDDPKVTARNRSRAARILLDRVLGSAPASFRKGAGTADVPDAKPKVRYVDPVALAESRAEIQRMKDEGILTPDPNAPEIDCSAYLRATDEEVAPYAEEAAAKFWARVDLMLERQKQWPEVEERRRKKLAQVYPSHSDDSEDETTDADPPDP